MVTLARLTGLDDQCHHARQFLGYLGQIDLRSFGSISEEAMAPGESARDVARRRREKAERLTRSAELWERGAQGEVATALALAELPPPWVALHDLRWPDRPRANIDHVVVGPGGVFVIDSKEWSGEVSLQDEVLRQNGRRRDGAVDGVREAAQAIGRVIGSKTVVPIPVLCVGADDRTAGRSRDVLICSRSNVTRMLMSRHPYLDANEVMSLSSSISGSLSKPTPAKSSVRRRLPAPRPRRSASRRRKRVAIVDVLKLAVLVSIAWVLSAHPEVVSSLLQAFLTPK